MQIIIKIIIKYRIPIPILKDQEIVQTIQPFSALLQMILTPTNILEKNLPQMLPPRPIRILLNYQKQIILIFKILGSRAN